jgi:AcrR family transcriptional regulator
MRQRAAATEATRDRIVEAAVELYAERGVAGTTMQEVARRADVVPTTVTNHFATSEELLEASVDRILRGLVLPDLTRVRRARSRSTRVAVLVAELFAFYDRSNSWYGAFRDDFGTSPALRRGEQEFWRSMQPLYETAIGPAFGDALIRGAVLGLTHPATLGALQESGLTTDQASTVVGDLLAKYLEARG